ncbi:hypothetical protein [Colwellia sp. RSH04]|uniref:hypothetical protein n=1 Tax=Colwellia sp. RSH04 TaxID=2305464 RepID=UPI000E5911A9|nr:hypothetical protein [Colwellia sp. RSH04]RHW77837.1 hypothetical protein D1094_02620 [Colwellia sp. RSH04]
MKLLLKDFIARHQTKLLFVTLWLHVTLLDFLNVTQRGSLFLWQESSEIKTLVTHLIIAVISILFYLFIKAIISTLTASKKQS